MNQPIYYIGYFIGTDAKIIHSGLSYKYDGPLYKEYVRAIQGRNLVLFGAGNNCRKILST